MVDNGSFTGAYDKKHFTFKRYDLEFLAVYIDGQQNPSKPLQPKYNEASAVCEFYQLVLSTDRYLKNKALITNRQDYLSGYNFYSFKLPPDEECGQHLTLIKSGNISLEVHFRQPLPNSINLILYVAFDSIVELTNQRQTWSSFTGL